MWAASECRNPRCQHITLEGMGVLKDGASLTGHFRCPSCATAYTRSTDFRIRQGKSTVPEATTLYSVMPVVCGQSPTQINRGNDFIGLVRPATSTCSKQQSRHLDAITAVGHDEACDEMFELALKDCVADPHARKNSEGLYILDVNVPSHSLAVWRESGVVVDRCATDDCCQTAVHSSRTHSSSLCTD